MPAFDCASIAGSEAPPDRLPEDPAEGSITSLSLAGLSAGRKLRLPRVRVGFTQSDLARMAGLSRSLVSDLERDRPLVNRSAAQLAAAAARVEAVLEPLEARWR